MAQKENIDGSKTSEYSSDEGFKEAEELFSKLADIEEQHEAKLLKLLKNLKNNEVFNKSTIKMWECRNCGHIHIGLSVPYECPVCKHPRAYFEIKKENY